MLASVKEELHDTLNILFVNITPREEVAIFVSSTFLRWDGVVLHDGRWDAVKRLSKCGVNMCAEVRVE